MDRRVKMQNWVYNCYVCIITDEEAAYVLGWSYKVAGMAGGLAGVEGQRVSITLSVEAERVAVAPADDVNVTAAGRLLASDAPGAMAVAVDSAVKSGRSCQPHQDLFSFLSWPFFSCCKVCCCCCS